MNSTRRDFLRIGGLGLCGVGLLDLVRAQLAAAGNPAPKVKQMIMCWMSGGPPHIDMFDMKPDAPDTVRGEFKPIQTSVPGFQISELMPNLARLANRYTILRNVATLGKPTTNHDAAFYWLTGNPRLETGTDDYPTYGSVVSKLRAGPGDLPTFTSLGNMEHYSRNVIGNSFLGPAHTPFIFDPTQSKDGLTRMLTPQLELVDFERNADFLKSIDTGLRRIDGQDALIEGLDQYRQTAFNMLRSPKLREAADLTREPLKSRERYARLVPAKPTGFAGNPLHFLLARRLIEVGMPIVHFNFGLWDWHERNFMFGREMIPQFDAGLAYLLEDLEERGLLDSTIVLALGEMGRTPKVNGSGRDHHPYAQFVFCAGGGFRRGAVVGATDKLGERIVGTPYKVESFARTLYHLLGIDPDTIVHTPSNRPIKLIVEDAPLIKEAIL